MRISKSEDKNPEDSIVKKIKYVQLEPAAILTDLDWQKMSAEERGVYWQIILTLYCHNGKIN